jgi:acetyl esterase
MLMMPLDPQVQGLLEAMAAQGMPPFHEMTVPQAREAAYAFVDLQGDMEQVTEVREVSVPVDGGGVAVRVYRPDSPGPLPLVVYFHGAGDTEPDRRRCARHLLVGGSGRTGAGPHRSGCHRHPAARTRVGVSLAQAASSTWSWAEE